MVATRNPELCELAPEDHLKVEGFSEEEAISLLTRDTRIASANEQSSSDVARDIVRVKAKPPVDGNLPGRWG